MRGLGHQTIQLQSSNRAVTIFTLHSLVDVVFFRNLVQNPLYPDFARKLIPAVPGSPALVHKRAVDNASSLRAKAGDLDSKINGSANIQGIQSARVKEDAETVCQAILNEVHAGY